MFKHCLVKQPDGGAIARQFTFKSFLPGAQFVLPVK